jgi:hypothetical protein
LPVQRATERIKTTPPLSTFVRTSPRALVRSSWRWHQHPFVCPSVRPDSDRGNTPRRRHVAAGSDELSDEAELVALYGAALGFLELRREGSDHVGEAALPVEPVSAGPSVVVQGEQLVGGRGGSASGLLGCLIMRTHLRKLQRLVGSAGVARPIVGR